ncbi:MAG TPA: hypothetical protein DCK78_00395 [Paenibacillus lactis]|nr:hypothetical protein [Paenibacillus lactis]
MGVMSLIQFIAWTSPKRGHVRAKRSSRGAASPQKRFVAGKKELQWRRKSQKGDFCRPKGAPEAEQDDF